METYRNYIATADKTIEHQPQFKEAYNEMLKELNTTELNKKIEIQITRGGGILYGERRRVTDKPPKWWLILTTFIIGGLFYGLILKGVFSAIHAHRRSCDCWRA
jgi:hypothetical protein